MIATTQHYPVPALRNDIISEAYHDLQMMVYNIAHGFSRKFRIPFDDMRGKAHELFVQHCDSYDPSHGAKLGTWIFSKVTWGLMSWMRTELRHWNLDSLDELQLAEQESGDDTRFLIELASEVSDDARTIINLILEGNDDFRLTCKWNKTRSTSGMLRSLREHLEDVGWGTRQIKASFAEIRRVLNDGAEPKPKKTKRVKERALRCVELTREDVWLSARVGLSPRQVRALTRA